MGEGKGLLVKIFKIENIFYYSVCVLGGVDITDLLSWVGAGNGIFGKKKCMGVELPAAKEVSGDLSWRSYRHKSPEGLE